MTPRWFCSYVESGVAYYFCHMANVLIWHIRGSIAVKGLQDTSSSQNTYIYNSWYHCTQLPFEIEDHPITIIYIFWFYIILIEAVHCRGPSISEHHVGQKVSRDLHMRAHVHATHALQRISLLQTDMALGSICSLPGLGEDEGNRCSLAQLPWLRHIPNTSK